ncbi:MAG TPA: YCF48-related protein [Chroococcidiopsis sp.]
MWGIGDQPAYAHRPHDVVSAVQVSSAYSEDSTVYIIVRNNLFRSSDGGNSWTRLVNGLDNGLFLSSLAVAPSDRNVLYTSAEKAGIYQSLDGGDTWKRVNGSLENLDIKWLQVSPTDANLVFAQIGEKTLYKTQDGGQSWKLVNPNVSATALTWSPDRSIIFLADAKGNLYRSDDQGDTWKFAIALPKADVIRGIVFSPDFANNQTFWVGTSQQGVYQSPNGGQTLVEQNQGLDDLRVEDIAVQPNSELSIVTWQGGYWHWDAAQRQWINADNGLTRDAMADSEAVAHFSDFSFSNAFDTDHSLFLGGFDGLYKSTNSGQTWVQLETLSLGTIIDLAISPTFQQDNTLAVATYVGELYLSQDRGDTWRAINQDLYLPRFTGSFQPIDIEKGEQDPRRFFDIEISPNYISDRTLFASILYQTILRSANQGQNWSLVNLDQSVRGVSLAISPNFKQDKTIFSTSQKGLIYRSQDGGNSFQKIGEGPAQVDNHSPFLVLSPNFTQDSTLFVNGPQGVYRSIDGGKTWQLLTEGTPLEKAGEIQLAISADFAASQTLFAASQNGLYRSQDRGETWQLLTSAGLGTQSWVEAIALSPNYAHDQTLMISVQGTGLLKSVDGGQTFTAAGNPNISIGRMSAVPSSGRSLQFSPDYATDQTIYGFGSATTEIYRSTDGGKTWQTLSIPRLRIEQIAPPSPLKTLGMFLNLNRRWLIGFGVLAGLLMAAYALGRRIPLARLQTRYVRLLICLSGVVFALGWVAFERLVAPQLSAETGLVMGLSFAALVWILTSPYFFRRFVGETTAESLGAIRMIVCGTLIIMTLWMEDLPSSALLPVAIRHSMGLIDYLYMIPGFEAFTRNQTGLQLFEWLTALLLLLGMIGLKTRWVLPLGGLCYLILGGILRQYTWFYHTGLIPVYLLAILSFTPCNDGLSVDRWLKRRRGQPVPAADQPAAIYGWSRYACWVILGVAYVQAGLSKIYYSGFYWWDPINLKAKLLATTLEPIQTNWDISLHLVNAPNIFFAVFGLVGLYGELAYGLVLFFRWARLVMPVLMAAVHLGIMFLQNIVFLDLILVQLIFFDYTETRRWLDKQGWLKRGWVKQGWSLSERDRPLRPQRLFFYPVLISVLLVSMSFIWVKHQEYYPFTSLQMFSRYDNSGVISYDKLIAHYASGETRQVFPDQFIYPPMNTRYRLTLRECHQNDAERVARCDQLLEALGDVHNKTAPPADRITAFELQQWVWDFQHDPSNPNYGKLEKTHLYPFKP